jgi:energy-coupling factor transporter ATP-binding protein EcfA2
VIQIEEIHIQELRGIRDLRLKLGSKSFVICGPNGSGKSGVVDAIDFAFTGSISRLTGAGSGGLTLLKHGPHVHCRDDPGVARVAVTFSDTASGKTAVLRRNVRTAKQYTLEPDIAEVRAAVEKAQQHPELTLSRREIIKYIVAETGKRSQEVQALLKLDRLGEIRSILRTTQTKTSSAEKTAQEYVKTAEDALRRHLDLAELLTSEVASVINRQRRVLGLEPIDGLDHDTDLNQGFDVDLSERAFNKVSAVRDTTALMKALPDPVAFLTAVKNLNEALDFLEADPNILTTLQQHDFVTAGLALITDAQCPLCDLEWPDVENLRVHLTDKLARSENAAKLQVQIQEGARATIAESQSLRKLIGTVKSAASSNTSDGLDTCLESWSTELAALETQLGSVEGAIAQRPRLTSDPLGLPEAVSSGLADLLATLQAKPDQSVTASAKTFLTIAQERWNILRQARAECTKKAAAQAVARVVYETYCEVSNEVLATLYHAVEDEFSTYYQAINADDESAFKAQLEPSAGKLDLAVDFYGIGMFPPTAYHSEGHQDGMGVCLYLALIKQLLGTDFRFAVLDDVVMSVDSNHRRQFCNLLKTRFPEVQFIITTHDEIWAHQMQSSGLVTKAAQVRLHSWTVDDGPAYEEAGDFWDKIDSDLAKSDVPPAAARLRRNLESIMADLAAALHGQVAYRAEGNYELGELLSAVKGKHGKLLNLAAKAANSWNDEVVKACVEKLKIARSAAVLAEESEYWAINRAVHFNEWANFSKADFIPVLAAWKQFLALFSCENSSCESLIYVVSNNGNEEALRCKCGSFNLNLRIK